MSGPRESGTGKGIVRPNLRPVQHSAAVAYTTLYSNKVRDAAELVLQDLDNGIRPGGSDLANRYHEIRAIADLAAAASAELQGSRRIITLTTAEFALIRSRYGQRLPDKEEKP